MLSKFGASVLSASRLASRASRNSFSPPSFLQKVASTYPRQQCRPIMMNLFAPKRLIDLEDDANLYPQDPQRHAAYLNELVEFDPLAVVKRYESQQFAINDHCTQLYLRALAKLGRSGASGSMFGSNRMSSPSSASLSSSSFNQSPYIDSSAYRPSSPYSSDYSPASPASPSSPFQQYSPFQTRPSYSAPSMASSSSSSPPMPFAGTQSNPLFVQVASSPNSQAMRAGKFIIGLLLLVGAGYMIMDERKGGAGPLAKSALGINTEFKPITESTKKFDDVKGCDEAKGELEEIVEFLKDPKKFTRLGGKLPKGVLLVGPPGTGKTLLAKAIAGEAGVPFFYVSGSEFEEMFVGVGARRVRELFAAAKRHSPCIIFIDEIDAVGAKRNPKDQQYMRMTLNQLLAEMDGFKSADGIIVVGATNFPESLDKALIRPGRFDRNVVVPPPDVEGRRQILDLYLKSVPKGPDVDTRVIARGTPGFCGADLANLVNVAALKASMENKTDVSMHDLEFAKDRIMMGAERKSAVLTPESLKCTAYHEGGHALVATLTDGALPIHKATIMPRGQALGMVQQLPEKDMDNNTLKQLKARLDVAMGGRVAEELIYGGQEVTTGAVSDIQAATSIARAMVTKFGMSPLGPVNFGDDASSKTKEEVDREVRRLCEESYQRAKSVLSSHEKELHMLAKNLLEYETLTGAEIKLLLANKPLDRKVMNGGPLKRSLEKEQQQQQQLKSNN